MTECGRGGGETPSGMNKNGKEFREEKGSLSHLLQLT